MKRIIFCIGFVFVLGTTVKAQRSPFYVDGYLLYNKDTTLCRIWLNPDTPYFKEDITVWLNEESKIISLEKDIKNLDGFGITQKGYQMHFGKIRVQGLSGWRYQFALKPVTGLVELYEMRYREIKKDSASYKLLISDAFSVYFIGRSDQTSYPILLKELKKKKISPFLKGYPYLKDVPDRTLSPQEVADLLLKYNTWAAGQK